ncbi:MAG: hypothetical protein J6J18_01610 [Oscillospiraceae bacterium]|nr:hypothetical protein [Oscillospiraceae bacterium]
MAKRKRYKEMEQLLTKVLIGDAAVFVLYLLFAGLGVTAMKVITAIIAILASGLCLALLYMSGEIRKRRSRWLVMGYGAIVVCLLVSLIVNYPSPAKAKATPAGSSTSTSEPASTDGTSSAVTDATDATGSSETGVSETSEVG